MNILRLSTLSLTLAIAVITLGYMNVASAAKPDCPGDHPSCKEAGGAAGYIVTIVGDVEGGSTENWLGGSKGVGLNDAGVHDGVGLFTDLSYFESWDFDGNNGDLCFLGADYLLHQAQIKQGKKGRAEAAFWFHGETTTGIRVLYALTLYGDFDPNVAWPPVNVEHKIMMNRWKMIVENEGKAIKDDSCIGEGTGVEVNIVVTKE